MSLHNNNKKNVGCNTTKFTKPKKNEKSKENQRNIIFCTTSAHIHLATTKYRLKTESIGLRPQRGSSILVGPSGMKEIDVCFGLVSMPLFDVLKTNRESSLLLFGLFSAQSISFLMYNNYGVQCMAFLTYWRNGKRQTEYIVETLQCLLTCSWRNCCDCRMSVEDI